MKEKKIAIVQSNYIPWKGYFDMIASADEFILYDDMQFTKRDWRNRNQIKTPQGLKWITVPVKVKGKYQQKIRNTEIDCEDWQSKHWKTLHANYQRAPYFKEIAEYLEPYYVQTNYIYLSQLNRQLIEAVNAYLGITTKISNSWDYELSGEKTEKLANLCYQAGGTEYISGPAAKNYLNEQVFTDKRIKVTWFSYEDYPEYNQLWGTFIHQVSILDLLFNNGKESTKYMKCVNSIK